MTETIMLNHMYVHILRTHHWTNPINTFIMCLWGKREKIFLAFSPEIWTEENKIINKLCGGVKMVCICVYTPDDAPFWKDTHCVLGLDDNGKVGACERNDLQRADQFLISSVCYEKKKLNIQNSVTKPQNFKPQFK